MGHGAMAPVNLLRWRRGSGPAGAACETGGTHGGTPAPQLLGMREPIAHWKCFGTAVGCGVAPSREAARDSRLSSGDSAPRRVLALEAAC
jgi:hypothetical protein